MNKGHRRNGSELIGGEVHNGDTGTMSISPTKAVIAPPMPAVEAPSVSRRRGHAHRRSGAVSSHDLSSILPPPKESRAKSLPTSPSAPRDEKQSPPFPNRSASHPVISTIGDVPLVDKSCFTSADPLPAMPRPRIVGFADKLEYISRPLSTISSETSSSMSTIRPTHSMSGSVTSIAGERTPSPPIVEASPPKGRFDESSISDHFNQSAIVTCGPKRKSSYEKFLEGKSKRGSEVAQSLVHNPTLTVCDMPISTRLQAGIHHEETEDPSGQAEGKSDFDKSGVLFAVGSQRPRTMSPVRRPNSLPVSKSSRSLKAHRSWIDPFRSRRAKSPPPEGIITTGVEEASTPVHTPTQDLDSFRLEEAVCLSMGSVPCARIANVHDSISRRPLVPSSQSPVEDSAGVIDLDALLHDSSSKHNIPGAHKNRMHSSISSRNVTVSGNFHRRAESAPEMAPAAHRGSRLNRFGSNNTMADVFEEDEEEEGSEAVAIKPALKYKHGAAQSGSIDELPTGFPMRFADTEQDQSSQTKRAKSCHARIPSKENASSTGYPESEPQSAITQGSSPFASNTETTPVDIVASDEEPRPMISFQIDFKASHPELSLHASAHYPPSPAFDAVHYGRASSFQTTNTEQMSSTVSSPDFTSTSFEDPRLDTARSSITDRTTLNSTRNGDRSSYRGSVDDIPPLSATSCSTSTTGVQPYWSGLSNEHMHSNTSIGEHRNSSSPNLGLGPSTSRLATASKRTSLASLSKLMGGGSHGERSKLNIEHRPASQEGREGKERKTRKRILRLMSFFRSKERHTS